MVIDALYRASQAGVPSTCGSGASARCGRASPGLSENIKVRSVLGRFLEHSRIYAFGAGEDEDSEVWIGSADMMHRNLDRRVELLVRVTDPGHQRRLRGLLDLGMDDGTSSWWLNPDGYWTAAQPGRLRPSAARCPGDPDQGTPRSVRPMSRSDRPGHERGRGTRLIGGRRE